MCDFAALITSLVFFFSHDDDDDADRDNDQLTHLSSELITLMLFLPLVFLRPNIVYVASNHFVWRLVPVSISSQIRQLLQDKQFELALQLAVRFDSQ